MKLKDMNHKPLINESTGPKLDTYVKRLRDPTKRAKHTVQDALEQSIKRLKCDIEKLKPEEDKSYLFNKIKKITNDLDVLKVLTEDEVIRYALTTSNKIMATASNQRVPRIERMKARVACHKPLSTHLAQLKQKLSKPQESDSESEDGQDKESSTLDKFTLNNIIVLMRKDVKRAKIHVIHKWTRTIKKCRGIKGDEEKVARFQKKAEKCVKKIMHIKEAHVDDISKFALSTPQNLNDLASNSKAPTASQAMSTIAIHKFVSSHISNFRSKYPDWQKIVPKLLNKKKKKRKLNIEKNDKVKNINNVSQRITESNDEDSKSEDDRESEHSERESGDEDDVESPTSFDEKGEERAGDLSDEMPRCGDVEGEDRVIINDSGESNALKECPEGMNLQDKILPKRKINKKEVTKKSKGTVKSSSLVEMESPVDEPKVVDPFFVTTTNEEYVTSQAPKCSEDNISNGKAKWEHFDLQPRKFDKFGHKNKWASVSNVRKHGKFSGFHETAPYNKQAPKIPMTDKLVFGNRKERRKALLQPQVEEKVEHLHPSWEAKKKQSIIIPFQGKKVTFN